jgi:hypothetical protein
MSTRQLDISLRVHHPEADLESVADVLKISPSFIWRRGDRAAHGSGIRDASYCSIQLMKIESGDLSSIAQEAMQRIQPAKNVIEEIARTGGKALLAIGWFCDGDAGAALPAGLLSEIADMKLGLDLYLYFSPPDGQIPSITLQSKSSS